MFHNDQNELNYWWAFISDEMSKNSTTEQRRKPPYSTSHQLVCTSAGAVEFECNLQRINSQDVAGNFFHQVTINWGEMAPGPRRPQEEETL